jgi:hypothetical protein
MSARQPNLRSGARRLAALSCGLGLLGLAACGSTSLPAGLSATGQQDQSSDPRVLRGGAAGGAVGSMTPVPGGPPVTMVPPARGGAGGAPPPMMPRDAGVARDAGFATDGGIPTSPDSGVIGVDGGLMPGQPDCRTGIYEGDAVVSDKRGLMMLRGCKIIAGSLMIIADRLEDLSDLSGLAQIRDTLQISVADTAFSQPPNRVLKSLKGLENLQIVSSVALIGLAGVADLAPLANLTGGASVLRLVHMDGLTDLRGLGATFSEIMITDNAQLKSLDGLHVNADVGQLVLSANPMLASLTALSPIKHVLSIQLLKLPSLKSLDGLQNLQTGYAQLSISECNALTDVSGLGAFANTIEITNNAELRSLSGPMPAAQPFSITLTFDPKLENVGSVVPADLDRLPILDLEALPGLKSLEQLGTLRQLGQLVIVTCDGLKDLTGLQALTSLEALQLADCAGLQSLKGLDALQSLDSLLLNSLTGLTSLQGMPKLQRLGTLNLADNSSLASLQGLEALTQLGEVNLSGNLTLASLHGLEKVAEIGMLNIGNNTALTNLGGLSGLQKVGSLQLSANPALKNLQGIGVASADSVVIEANPMLTDLTGLEKLANIGSGLSITENGSLTSLRALTALTAAGGLDVGNNRRLPQCEVEWLAKRLNLAPTGPNGPPGMCAP